MALPAPLRDESAVSLVRRGAVLAAIPAIYTLTVVLLAKMLPGTFNTLLPALSEFLSPRLLSLAAEVALIFCCLAFAAPVRSKWYRACRWVHDRNAEFSFSCGCIILGVVLSSGLSRWVFGGTYPGWEKVVGQIGVTLVLLWGTSRHVFSESSPVHAWLTTPRWMARVFSGSGVIIMVKASISALPPS